MSEVQFYDGNWRIADAHDQMEDGRLVRRSSRLHSQEERLNLARFGGYAPAPAPRKRRQRSKLARVVDMQQEAQCGAHSINNLLQRRVIVYDFDNKQDKHVCYHNMAYDVAKQNAEIQKLDESLVDEAGDTYGNVSVDVVEAALRRLKLQPVKIQRTAVEKMTDKFDDLPELYGYIVPHTRHGSLHYMSFRREAANKYVFIDSIPDRSNLIVYSLEDVQKFMLQKCIEKRGREKMEGLVMAVFASTK